MKGSFRKQRFFLYIHKMKQAAGSIGLILSFALSACFVHAQTRWIDSVKKVLLTQRADTNKVKLLTGLGETYALFEPDSAFACGQQALALAKKLHSNEGIFWSIVIIHKALYALGNYALDLDYAFEAWPIGQKLNNTYTLGWCDGMMGDCYFNMGQYNEALRHYRIILKRAEKDSIRDLPELYVALVPVFENLKLYDSALFYARKGYALFKSKPALNEVNDDNIRIKCFQFRFLGEAFAGMSEYDSALYYYKLSLSTSQAIRMEINNLDVYNGLAKIYKTKNKLDSAVYYATMVAGNKTASSYLVAKLQASNLLTDIYETKNRPDSALKYIRMAIVIQDSLYNKDKMLSYQNIIFKDQEKQREVQDTESRLQREYLTYFLIFLLTITIIISGVVIRNRRIKQLQNIRNSIADDLHDDIGSALSSISIMNELAKQRSPEVLPQLASISESTTTIQENMSDIIWTIKSNNDRFENVLQRMNQFASEILDAKNVIFDFKSDASLSASRLSMEKRKNFYLFFKEVINNIAKYADAKKVTVCIYQKDRRVEMDISDDGKGFDTSKIFNGNGMASLKKRATELNGDFKIISCINRGTDVRLKFKIT
jgi:two-component system, NarL family, sensor histidine kinase UhpB